MVDTVAAVAGETPASLEGWSLELLPASRLAETPVAINDLSTATSSLLVQGVPAGQVVDGVTVSVSIAHPIARELNLYLVAPNGLQVPLALGRGGNTADAYLATTFDDAAALSIRTAAAPFGGSYRPEQLLAAFDGLAPNGTWQLIVVDQGTAFPALSEGELLSWSLTLSLANSTITPPSGNMMDQDTDATPGEVNDAYAAPRSFAGIAFPSSLDRGINGTPFQFPFDSMTLPLMVPGPHVVATQVAGVPKVADNLVADQPSRPSTSPSIASWMRIRSTATTCCGSTARSAPSARTQVTRSPRGSGSRPSTAAPSASTSRRPRARRLPLTRSGTYTLVLGPQILSAAGDAVDANQNAGLDALRGTVDPQTGVTVPLTIAASGAQVGLPIPDRLASPIPTVVRSQINLDDDFLIGDLNLQLNISHRNVPDLEARLIAVDPSGDPNNDITVLLFANVGATGDRTDFRNTIFDDQATTPIQNGGPPFDRTFSPQVGLADPNRPGTSGVSLGFLNDKASARTWVLEITNNGRRGRYAQ